MAGRGVATVAIAAILVVVLAGAAIFGYMYLLPANQTSSTTQSQSSFSVSGAPNIPVSTTSGAVKISNAALSNDSLLVTIQNTGTQAVSLDALLITPGAGCTLTASNATSSTSQTSQANRTRSSLALTPCLAGAAEFLVQSNSTLKPLATGRFNFNFTRLFNSSSFNSTSFSRTFSRSGNSSGVNPGNFSGLSGNFSRALGGNFSAGFPLGFLGNLTAGSGLQLGAGQSVTLAYSGAIGSGVKSGSQYTIMVAGLDADAQITLSAS